MFFGSSQVIDFMERETGIEPATSSLGSWHSTAELLPLVVVPSFTLPNSSNDRTDNPNQRERPSFPHCFVYLPILELILPQRIVRGSSTRPVTS